MLSCGCLTKPDPRDREMSADMFHTLEPFDQDLDGSEIRPRSRLHLIVGHERFSFLLLVLLPYKTESVVPNRSFWTMFVCI